MAGRCLQPDAIVQAVQAQATHRLACQGPARFGPWRQPGQLTVARIQPRPGQQRPARHLHRHQGLILGTGRNPAQAVAIAPPGQDLAGAGGATLGQSGRHDAGDVPGLALLLAQAGLLRVRSRAQRPTDGLSGDTDGRAETGGRFGQRRGQCLQQGQGGDGAILPRGRCAIRPSDPHPQRPAGLHADRPGVAIAPAGAGLGDQRRWPGQGAGEGSGAGRFGQHLAHDEGGFGAHQASFPQRIIRAIAQAAGSAVPVQGAECRHQLLQRGGGATQDHRQVRLGAARQLQVDTGMGQAGTETARTQTIKQLDRRHIQ